LVLAACAAVFVLGRQHGFCFRTTTWILYSNDNIDNKDNGETPTWRFLGNEKKGKRMLRFSMLSVLSMLSLKKKKGKRI
jgi:hypothetical protein